jgi:hypothetical protein
MQQLQEALLAKAASARRDFGAGVDPAVAWKELNPEVRH